MALSILRDITSWLGIGAPRWLNNAIARRNMPLLAAGAICAGLFASMLVFCLITETPCPVDSFDEASRESEAVMRRFEATCTVALILLCALFAYAVTYIRRGWNQPHIAMAAAALMSFLFVMLWGIAESGLEPMRQMLVFASVQFLIAGLIVYPPIVSLLYFGTSFFLFGTMYTASGHMDAAAAQDLVYLALLDVVVSWLVYGLFKKYAERERTIADQSRRDELTGAKNRHYLRDDFGSYVGANVFVMLCDIDDFKHFNDDFDHDVGDYFLQQFYYALREAFGDECTYRYGGDEFLVASPDYEEEAFLRKTAKVSAQLELISKESDYGNVTFSGGYAHGVPESEADFRDMMHRADEKLLEAKRAGKNRIVC